MPARSSAGENRLPRGAEWPWTATLRRPGLIPVNSSRTPSAIRSGKVAPVNAFSSARVKLTLEAYEVQDGESQETALAATSPCTMRTPVRRMGLLARDFGFLHARP